MEIHGGHHAPDQELWVGIRNRTKAIQFGRYRAFVDRVLGDEASTPNAYELLQLATQTFLLSECGVFGGEQSDGRTVDPGHEFKPSDDVVETKLREYLGAKPQLRRIAHAVNEALPVRDEDPGVARLLMSSAHESCLIELIWSYWLEEGMLIQTMNEVANHFQNPRAVSNRNPLSGLNTDRLRPLGNILSAFLHDEPRRLTLQRRSYEYSHQYGLSLSGKVAHDESVFHDSSNFVEAFHKVLRLAITFFKDDDKKVTSDENLLLRAIKEVHVLLAEGAHNQFGDLPWTARAEMLQQQWILARPELHDFLNSQGTPSYEEPWMPQVDMMKNLQGWPHISITHFRDLAVYGERIVLSMRYGNWGTINDQDCAREWARYWRPEIQGYVHAYPVTLESA